MFENAELIIKDDGVMIVSNPDKVLGTVMVLVAKAGGNLRILYERHGSVEEDAGYAETLKLLDEALSVYKQYTTAPKIIVGNKTADI